VQFTDLIARLLESTTRDRLSSAEHLVSSAQLLTTTARLFPVTAQVSGNTAQLRKLTAHNLNPMAQLVVRLSKDRLGRAQVWLISAQRMKLAHPDSFSPAVPGFLVRNLFQAAQ